MPKALHWPATASAVPGFENTNSIGLAADPGSTAGGE
jgi:hypothetical protein